MTNLATTSMETIDLSALNLGKIPVETLLIALGSLIVCLVATKIAMHFLRKVLAKTPMEQRLQKYLIGGVRTVLWIVSLLVFVDALGIPITSVLTLLSVFTLAITLAVQGFLSNVAGGLILLSNKPFKIGDYVETDGGSGYIRDLRLTVTVLETRDGVRITIPNSMLSTGTIKNYDMLGRRRAEVTVTASYDAPIPTVREALMQAVAATDKVLSNPKPAVIVSNYGESSIEYQVFCWCKSEDYWAVLPRVTEQVKYAFDAKGVEMTYNHLNVHIMDKE